MSIKVLADPNGDFRLDMNTEGVPFGEFLITADRIERTVQIVLTEPTPSSTQRSPAITSTPTPVITPPIFTIPMSSSSPTRHLISGFEALLTIAGLFTVAYLVLRLRRK